MRPITALLIGATCVTGGILFLCLAMIGWAFLTEPAEWGPDAGANIGLGLLQMALVLNVPVIVAWGLWWSLSSGKRAG